MMPLELFHHLLRQLDRLLVFLHIKPFGLLRRGKSKRNGVQSPIEHDVVLPPSMPILRPLHEFQREVFSLFSEPCNINRMRYMSSCLTQEYAKSLRGSTASMLPSFCHTLPTGQEQGTFIALDLGGSTFRVALIELSTRSQPNGGMDIKHMTVHKIDEHIRQLPSRGFFAWMAGKIHATLHQSKLDLNSQDEPISVGLAWSFPLEQTSYRGGTVQPMGKGFKAHEGIVGHDLGSLIESACQDLGLAVRVNAIINDSSATLLSQAYTDSSTSMGLILGTGTNAAVYLPVSTIGTHKFGKRDPAWFEQAEKVIINTEVSMFGKGILPETRWDEELNRVHILPDFQPLEYMTTGRYLGEIFRLIITEAVLTCHMFGGVMPDRIQERYTLDTALLAAIEEDTTAGYISSAERVQKEFGLFQLPTPAEMSFLRTAVESISHRAAAYIAIAIHSLWALEHNDRTQRSSKTTVAANGSVVSKYPGFKNRCQKYANDLITTGQPSYIDGISHEITIQPGYEATLFGVAVAVAVADST